MSAGTQRYWIRNLGYYIAVITSLCRGNGNDVLNKDRFTMSFRIIEVQHQATHPINTTTQRASSTTRVGMNGKENSRRMAGIMKAIILLSLIQAHICIRLLQKLFLRGVMQGE